MTAREQLTAAAAGLGPAAAWPTAGDAEPVFAEPWEGRAFAMALELVERDGRSWDDFRTHLISAIAADPHRPYFESWVIALEHLALEIEAVTIADLDGARNRAASYRYDDALGDVEVFPFDVASIDLDELLGLATGGRGVDGRHREHATTAIGDAAHAELYRTWTDGAPRTWGLRFFDITEAALLDIVLPSPFAGGGKPDWTRLDTWEALRRRVLGLGPDPLDRTGRA